MESGQIIAGRYTVIKELGSGGFGTTYLATDTQFPGQPTVVVKQLTFDPTSEVFDIVKGKFEKEGETLAILGKKVDGVPVLMAYIVDEKTNQFFLVQEYIDGVDLEKYSQTNKWTNGQIIWFLKEALKILIEVKENNIIHRDIKPSNFILSKEGKLYLIDFGAVKEVVSPDKTTASGTSAVIGTPGYMSPEQANGHPNFKSDLYSLGMTALYFLTGKNPANFERVDSEIMIENLLPELNQYIRGVIQKSVAFSPNGRYKNPTEMYFVLDDRELDFGLPKETTVQGIEPTVVYNQKTGGYTVPTEIYNSPNGQVPPTEKYQPNYSDQQSPVPPTEVSIPNKSKKLWLIGGLFTLLAGGVLAAMVYFGNNSQTVSLSNLEDAGLVEDNQENPPPDDSNQPQQQGNPQTSNSGVTASLPEFNDIDKSQNQNDYVITDELTSLESVRDVFNIITIKLPNDWQKDAVENKTFDNNGFVIYRETNLIISPDIEGFKENYHVPGIHIIASFTPIELGDENCDQDSSGSSLIEEIPADGLYYLCKGDDITSSFSVITAVKKIKLNNGQNHDIYYQVIIQNNIGGTISNEFMRDVFLTLDVI